MISGFGSWDLAIGNRDLGLGTRFDGSRIMQLGDGFVIGELRFGTRDMTLRTWDDGLGVWDKEFVTFDLRFRIRDVEFRVR